MKSLTPNKVFVSVETAYSDQNELSIRKAKDLLRREDVSYTLVNGVYHDIPEKSFMLASTDINVHEDNLQAALNLARLFNQESVLEVLNDGTSYLHYIRSGDKIYLGVFQSVSKEVALAQSSYTEYNGVYFIVSQC